MSGRLTILIHVRLIDEPPMLQKFERRQLKLRELKAANMLDEDATQKLAPINKYKEDLGNQF